MQKRSVELTNTLGGVLEPANGLLKPELSVADGEDCRLTSLLAGCEAVLLAIGWMLDLAPEFFLDQRRSKTPQLQAVYSQLYW